MITIAIECESVEKDVWGVSREVRQLLFELSKRSDLADTHRFLLYFKSEIPVWNFTFKIQNKSVRIGKI